MTGLCAVTFLSRARVETAVKIGVAAVQGAVSEHVDAVRAAASRLGVEAEVVGVRDRASFSGTDGLIIPGGESTTISKMFAHTGLRDEIRRRVADEDYPILGTCAGLILLASQGDDQVEKTRTELLSVMDVAVDRNAFGRQRESFERDVELQVPGFPGLSRFHAVFIRAPAVTRVWGDAEAVCRLDDRVIGVRQGRRLALAFHPELTSDTRVHEAFLRSIA